jgi:hypothetical protein
LAVGPTVCTGEGGGAMIATTSLPKKEERRKQRMDSNAEAQTSVLMGFGGARKSVWMEFVKG